MASPSTIPNFKDLPLRPNIHPTEPGGFMAVMIKRGTLKRLTDKLVVNAARDEIKNGRR